MIIYISMIESREDKRKFEELYISYKQTMFYVANKILRDEHLSEDVVHQAFIRILNNLDKIEGVDSKKTKAFVVVIVENIAIDFYRKRKNENRVSFDEVDIYIGDEREENDLVLSDIEEAILKIPVNYSSVLRLKYSQGYSNKEISEILNISEENVRQRISRGKKRLQEILNDEEGKING